MTCKYFDSGWCYAPEDVEHNSKNGSCIDPLSCPYNKENKTLMTTQKDLECETEELRLEIKENAERIDKLCNLLKQNNTKLRTLKQMTNQTPCNHRTPYKPEVQYYDEQMVIVNGIQYQRVEPPKPQTLYDTLYEKGSMYSSVCDTVVKIVTEWMPNDDPHDGELYQLGWNACLNYLRERLK